jgi:hypothetical protein
MDLSSLLIKIGAPRFAQPSYYKPARQACGNKNKSDKSPIARTAEELTLKPVLIEARAGAGV